MAQYFTSLKSTDFKLLSHRGKFQTRLVSWEAPLTYLSWTYLFLKSESQRCQGDQRPSSFLVQWEDADQDLESPGTMHICISFCAVLFKDKIRLIPHREDGTKVTSNSSDRLIYNADINVASDLSSFRRFFFLNPFNIFRKR